MNNTVLSLKAGSAIVIFFGILVTTAIFPATDFILKFLIDLIFWPIDGAQTFSSPEFRLILAISGAVVIGWGLILWIISSKLYPSDPLLARTMILTSMGAWFVIDCTLSILVGAPLNVLLNIPFLLLFVIPLWHAPEAPETGRAM